MTTQAEKSVEVDLPVGEAYQLWSDFENFPRFMSNVESVKVMGPGMLHWKASILGVEREWDAEVVEQVEGQRIAWRSTSGTENSGEVSFEALNNAQTRVTLHLHFEPEGFVEGVGDKLGLAADGAEGDLTRFKEYAEEHYAGERVVSGHPGAAGDFTTMGALNDDAPSLSSGDTYRGAGAAAPVVASDDLLTDDGFGREDGTRRGATL